MNVFITILLASSIVTGCANSQQRSRKEENPAKLKPVELVTPPAMITDPQKRADYILTHFWDKFDFTDTMYCHAPDITEAGFSNFLSIFQHASHEKMLEGVKKLMTMAEVDSVMYDYFFKKAEHYLYNPNSPARNDGFFIPFLEHVVASTSIDDDHKIRPQRLLALALRNRAGTKALDFDFTMAGGKTERLYNLKAEKLLLIFYNPDCSECRRTMDILKGSKIVTDEVASNRLKILTVYPDEKLDAWKNHPSFPPSWIDGYDHSLAVRHKELYDLKAIPTLYLLDGDKTVILKDVNVENLQDWLEKNKAGTP